jgi:glycosyltransferase involved in cell wall biosynthesis
MITGTKYIIVAPCYNEEQVIDKFLREIERKLAQVDATFLVVIVDDASVDASSEILSQFRFANPKFDLKVIRLNSNMGHQEAIRQGLQYAHRLQEGVKGIIVMDSDGEDDPSAIVKLAGIETFDIVQVERGKRHESLKFKVGYFFYKLLFGLVTGKYISFGNFSMISPLVLRSIHNQSFFHYAGFLSKQKFKKQKVRFDRQKRIDGKSKMSYKGLVLHGLNSLIEYAEEILYFLLKTFVFVLFLVLSLGIFVLYSKFVTHKALYGWTSSVGMNLVIAAIIICSTIIIGLLLLSIKKTINQKNEQFREVN